MERPRVKLEALVEVPEEPAFELGLDLSCGVGTDHAEAGGDLSCLGHREPLGGQAATE
jgi:hypothetical protein